MAKIEIKPIADTAGCTAVEQLQIDAWKLADYREVVPVHMLLTFHKNGGVLLGAYAGEQLVGFVAGFVGLMANGRFKHASHQLGIHPQFQGRGIGTMLKLAQRQAVQQQGLDLITWTYDPLEIGNARLNIHKLGATCRTYIPNLYGNADGINAGLPTDRFQVDWHINSAHVENRLAGRDVRETAVHKHLILNPVGENGRPTEKPKPPTEPIHFVQIPHNFQALKAQDMPLAQAWRLHTRQLFINLFAQNYTVTDFVLQNERAFYQLTNY
ncbi:GNAT family N-acetyltransferase [Candidatus Leptofilum sp.]|uniref:GNAT family N-acetyltransferase n=1 Tax=Candidatus Leptofilum sp. TaxID=3241576 RepID=UPI003B5B823C